MKLRKVDWVSLEEWRLHRQRLVAYWLHDKESYIAYRLVVGLLFSSFKSLNIIYHKIYQRA